MATCDPNVVMAAGKAFQACSDRDLLIAECELLCVASGTSPDPNAIMAAGKAFQALSDYDLLVVVNQLMCNA